MKEQSISQPLSDSELSLQLSDASTLSSDSEPENAHNDRRFSDTKSVGKSQTKKRSATSTKNSSRRRSSAEEKLYCVCRKGYDGKEFMIACDECQEWFHGRCVGVKPKSVTGQYFCGACIKAKSRKSSSTTNNKGRKGKTKRKPKKSQPPPPPAPNPPHPPPSIPEHAAVSLSREEEEEEEEEDLDDICPVCDTECTCGAEVKISNDNNLVATDPWQVTDEKIVVERVGVDEDEPQQHQQQQHQTSDDVDIDVSDQDYLHDDAKSASYTSSIHIDSGDDEGLEKEEEEAIIRDMLENGSDESGYTDSADDADEDEDTIYYYANETDHDEDDQQIDDPERYYPLYLGNGWSTSEEEEEEEEEEEDNSDDMEEDQDDDDEEESNGQSEVLLPSGPDDQKKLFDSIAAAFMEILTPLVNSSTGTGDGSDSHVDMASLLGIAPPVDQTHSDIGRRLSLPSSAVSAAVHDHTEKLTSDTLSALSVLQPDLSLPPTKDGPIVANDHASAFPFPHDPASLQYDIKLQEHLLDLVHKRTNSTAARHIMPKPPESSSETSDKKRNMPDPCMTGKKPRLSSPPSSPMESEQPVIPVSMDDLVDTSQLYTRSTSRSPSPEPDELDTQLSRDLSRWQRVPIGAFRLMRSKNKLWLER